MLLLNYASQLSYGKYGMHICTPVSCAVGIVFVSHVAELSALFPAPKVDLIMKRSHELYEERFSKNCQNLMVDDIKALFPTEIKHIDAAGILCSSDSLSVSLVMCDDDETISIILVSLNHLVSLLLESNKRVAVVITYRDHTHCLFIENKTVFKFDPLICTIAEIEIDKEPSTTEYSAILLFHIKETEFFSKFLKDQCAHF